MSEKNYIVKNPCEKREIILKECLEQNEKNIKYCQKERLLYELCLKKNKKYKCIFK